MAQDFEAALSDLQDHLPSWWPTSNPTSQMYKLLAGVASVIDQLSNLFEQPYLDEVITTASQTGLFRNFALAWGLQNEQLPTVTSQLAAYIQARAAETGSLQSLINTLTALVNQPVNQGGPVLTFPAGGGGLTFPANGSGLIMYQYTSPQLAPVFPADGSGLTFPADGSGITLGAVAWIDLLPNYSTYTLTVKVLEYLAFDRNAFTRAVNRFQPADWLPSVVQQVPSF